MKKDVQNKLEKEIHVWSGVTQERGESTAALAFKNPGKDGHTCGG